MQRRDAVAIRGGHVGAGAQQAVDDLAVALANGPMQRRGAVSLRGHGVVVLAREIECRRAIAALQRLHQTGHGGACQRGGREQRNERRRTEPLRSALRSALLGSQISWIRAGAVAERVDFDVDLVEQRHEQVRLRRVLGAHDVLAALQLAAAAADHDVRQRVVIVRVAVAHVAAVEQHRVIQQRAVAVLRRVELRQELAEQADVERLNARQHLELLGLVLVVRDRMVPFGDADLRVGAVADLARHHEREHARDVGAVGEREQVVHQPHVLRVLERNAAGRLRDLDVGVRGDLRFRALQTTLDLANALEVVVEHVAVVLRRDCAAGPWSAPSRRRGCSDPRWRRTRRIAALSPCPNIRSNTLRGLISIGIGVVGVRHDSVFIYIQP